MSPAVKFALAAPLLVAVVAVSAAADHPHDKESKAKAAIVENETVIQFEEDLNAHFEKHAKTLRDALNAAKDTKSRIIVKELKSDESTALAGSEAKVTKRIELIENPEELRSAARSIQNLLADSGILESLADVVIDLAEDIQIDDTGDGMRLSFNGNRIGGFSMDENHDSLSIEAMGSNTTIEKDVIIENGKKKTRIVIITDGDDIDFDIVPKSRKPRANTEF